MIPCDDIEGKAATVLSDAAESSAQSVLSQPSPQLAPPHDAFGAWPAGLLDSNPFPPQVSGEQGQFEHSIVRSPQSCPHTSAHHEWHPQSPTLSGWIDGMTSLPSAPCLPKAPAHASEAEVASGSLTEVATAVADTTELDGPPNCCSSIATLSLPDFAPPLKSPFSVVAEDIESARVLGWLRALIAPDQVVELRALDVSPDAYRRPHVESGFYDGEHLKDMACAALHLSASAKGVYFTLNPVNPDLLARRANRVGLAQSDETTADKDVLRRRWLLIDVDPKRVAGVSASDAEKKKAADTMLQIRQYLHERHWPRPIVGDSGNGYHLLYRIDEPVDDDGLVKRVLHALAGRFDSEAVLVDRAVFNPARICKLYGTQARKGDDVSQRPHRWTGLCEVPEPIMPVSRAQLESLAGEVADRDEQNTSTPVAPQPSKTSDIERARAYLAKLPPAISGQGGHKRTFRAACCLVHGFALSVEESLPLLSEWNERCQPPWSNTELLHKLNDAEKKPGQRGYLLKSHGKEQVASRFELAIIDSQQLEDARLDPNWLVKQILVRDQLAVVGGPKKALKTTLTIDLAISLASGTRFLGKFDIVDKTRVLVLSGESGLPTLRDAAKRICQSRGLTLRACDIHWSHQLPQLSNTADLTTLSTLISERNLDVVVIDPLYLCLLASTSANQAGNVYYMGSAVMQAAAACLSAGATPIFVHHTTAQATRGKKSGEALDLEDLAYSGIGEAARQWLILSRREAYDHDVGDHKLWLRVGGSAGHGGLYALDVREGVLNDSFGGRGWQVVVQTASKAIEQQAKARAEEEQERKRLQRDRRDAERTQAVITAMERLPGGATAPDIAEAAGVPRRDVSRILSLLLQSLKVLCTEVRKPFGRGQKTQPGWVLEAKYTNGKRVFSDAEYTRLRSGETIEAVLRDRTQAGSDQHPCAADHG